MDSGKHNKSLFNMVKSFVSKETRTGTEDWDEYNREGNTRDMPEISPRESTDSIEYQLNDSLIQSIYSDDGSHMGDYYDESSYNDDSVLTEEDQYKDKPNREGFRNGFQDTLRKTNPVSESKAVQNTPSDNPEKLRKKTSVKTAINSYIKDNMKSVTGLSPPSSDVPSFAFESFNCLSPRNHSPRSAPRPEVMGKFDNKHISSEDTLWQRKRKISIQVNDPGDTKYKNAVASTEVEIIQAIQSSFEEGQCSGKRNSNQKESQSSRSSIERPNSNPASVTTTEVVERSCFSPLASMRNNADEDSNAAVATLDPQPLAIQEERGLTELEVKLQRLENNVDPNYLNNQVSTLIQSNKSMNEKYQLQLQQAQQTIAFLEHALTVQPQTPSEDMTETKALVKKYEAQINGLEAVLHEIETKYEGKDKINSRLAEDIVVLKNQIHVTTQDKLTLNEAYEHELRSAHEVICFLEEELNTKDTGKITQSTLKEKEDAKKLLQEKDSQMKDLQKQLEILSSENQVIHLKYDHDIDDANQSIISLQQKLHLELESQKLDKQVETSLDKEIKSLRKANTSIQNKYEDKLHKAENAIESLENAVRAQVLSRNEDKKIQATLEQYAQERNDRILELEAQVLSQNEDKKIQATLEQYVQERNDHILDLEERCSELENKVNVAACAQQSKDKEIQSSLDQKVKEKSERIYELEEENNGLKCRLYDSEVANEQLLTDSANLKITIDGLTSNEKVIVERNDEKLRSLEQKMENDEPEDKSTPKKRIFELQVKLRNLELSNHQFIETNRQLTEKNSQMVQIGLESEQSTCTLSTQELFQIQDERISMLEIENEELKDKVKTIENISSISTPEKENRPLLANEPIAPYQSELSHQNGMMKTEILCKDVSQVGETKDITSGSIISTHEQDLLGLMRKNVELSSSNKELLYHVEKLSTDLEECESSKTSLQIELDQLSKNLEEATKNASRSSEVEVQLNISEDRAAALEREKLILDERIQSLQTTIAHEATFNKKRTMQHEENHRLIMKDLDLAYLEKQSRFQIQNSSLQERLSDIEAHSWRIPELEEEVRKYDNQCKVYIENVNDLKCRVSELEELKQKCEDSQDAQTSFDYFLRVQSFLQIEELKMYANLKQDESEVDCNDNYTFNQYEVDKNRENNKFINSLLNDWEISNREQFNKDENHTDKVNLIRKKLEDTMRRNISLGACISSVINAISKDEGSIFFEQIILLTKIIEIQKVELEKVFKDSLIQEMKICQINNGVEKNVEELQMNVTKRLSLETEVQTLRLNIETLTSSNKNLLQNVQKPEQSLEEYQSSNTSHQELIILNKKLEKATTEISELKTNFIKSENRALSLDRAKLHVEKQLQNFQTSIDQECTSNGRRVRQYQENNAKITNQLEITLENNDVFESEIYSLKERLSEVDYSEHRVVELEGMVKKHDIQCESYKDEIENLKSCISALKTVHEEMKEKVDSAELRVVKLGGMVKNHDIQCVSYKDQIENLESFISALEAVHEETKEKVDSAELRVVKFEEMVKNNDIQCVSYNDEIESLKHCIPGLEAAHEEMKEKLAQSTLDKNECINNSLQMKMDYQKIIHEGQNANLRCTEDKISSMNQAIVDFQLKIRNHETTDLHLKEINKQLSEKNMQLENQVNVLCIDRDSTKFVHEQEIKNLETIKNSQDTANAYEQLNIQEQRISVLEDKHRKMELKNDQIEEKNKILFQENETLKKKIEEISLSNIKNDGTKEEQLRIANETIKSLQDTLDCHITSQSETINKIVANETELSFKDEPHTDETTDPKTYDSLGTVCVVRKKLEKTMRRNITLGACVATLKSMLPEDDEFLSKHYSLMSEKIDCQKTELLTALRESLQQEMKISILNNQLKKTDEQLQNNISIRTNLETEVHRFQLINDEVTSSKMELLNDMEILKLSVENYELSKASENTERSIMSKKLDEAMKKASRLSELETQLKKSNDCAAALDREKSHVDQQLQILQTKIDREASLNEKRMTQYEENHIRIMKELEQAVEKKSAVEVQNSSLKEKMFEVEAVLSRVTELEETNKNSSIQCISYKDELKSLNSRILELEGVKEEYNNDRNALKYELSSIKEAKDLTESNLKELKSSLDDVKIQFIKYMTSNHSCTRENLSMDEPNSLRLSLKSYQDLVNQELSHLIKNNINLTKAFEEIIEKLQIDLVGTVRSCCELEEELKKSISSDEQEISLKMLDVKAEELLETKRELEVKKKESGALKMEIVNLRIILRDAEDKIAKGEESRLSVISILEVTATKNELMEIEINNLKKIHCDTEETRTSMKTKLSILEESCQSSSKTIEQQSKSISKLEDDLENSKCRERIIKEEGKKHHQEIERNFMDATAARDKIEEESKLMMICLEDLEDIERKYVDVTIVKDRLEEESKRHKDNCVDSDARVLGLQSVIDGLETAFVSQKNHILSLQEDNSSLMTTVNNLKKETSFHKSRVSEIEQDLSLSMKKINAISKKYAKLEEEAGNLSWNLKEAKRAVKDYEEKIDELVSFHKARVSEIEQDLSSTMKKINVISKRNAELEEDAVNLSWSLKEAKRDVKDYEEKIADVKHDSSSLLAVSDGKITHLTKEKKSLSAELDEKIRLLEKLKIRYEKNEDTILSLERTIEASNNSFESLKNSFDNQLRRLRDDKKVLKGQRNDFEIVIQKNLLENENIRFELETTTEELYEANKCNESLSDEMNDLAETLKRAKESLSHMAKLQAELEEAEECLTHQKIIHSNDQKQLLKISMERNQVKNEFRIVKSKVRSLENAFSEKQERVDELQREIEYVTGRGKKIEQRSSQNYFSDSSKTNKSLQEDVTKMRKKLDSYEQNDSSLRSQISAVESEYRETISHMRKEVKVGKNRNKEMEKELKQNIDLLEMAKQSMRK